MSYLRASGVCRQVHLAQFAVAVFCCVASSSASAGPKDGKVVGGAATITEPNATTVNIHQSTNRAIINWKSFNIDRGETTQFFQPSPSAITLNRVTASQSPSRILGNLKANGMVVISNPDGILFGAHARVDVGGLIATTSDIRNDDFMAGRMNFNIPGNPKASIINQGSISIADYGIGAFVAPGVRNEGVIAGRLSTISLVAANGFGLDLYGDGLVKIMVDDEITKEVIDVATGKPMNDLVKNDGRITANGGVVAMRAATARRAVNSIVNNTGIIAARSIGQKNGMIILGGQTKVTKKRSAPTQRVQVAGRIDASGKRRGEKGGHIRILGEEIIADGVTISASGDLGGGRVLIGGDYFGGRGAPQTIAQYNIPLEDDVVPTAERVYISDTTSIDADALRQGNGGKIVVWSDGITIAAGTFTARGGSTAGDGGFIETSGKQTLQMTGLTDVSAVQGKAGTWLLDPENIRIGGTTDTVVVSPGVTFTAYLNTSVQGTQFTSNGTNGDSFITADLIEQTLNNGTNVYIFAENIQVSDSITKSSGGAQYLTINALNDLDIDADVEFRSTSGPLSVRLFAQQGDVRAVGLGDINLDGGSLLIASSHNIAFTAASFTGTREVQVYTESRGGSGNVRAEDRSIGDRIVFTHDGRVATIDTNGFLVSQTDTRWRLRTSSMDVALANNAIRAGSGSWGLRLDGSGTWGALTGVADDGIPEVETASSSFSLIATDKDPRTSELTNLLEVRIASNGELRLYDTKTGELLRVGPRLDAPKTSQPVASIPQATLNPDSAQLSAIANTTPTQTTQLSLVQDKFFDVFKDQAMAEVTSSLTRLALEGLWKIGALNVWRDQLDAIAIEGIVASKLKALGNPSYWASLGKSLALEYIKKTLVDTADVIAKDYGVHSTVRAPMRYLLNTGGDALIFSTLYPEVAAQAPQLVLVVSAAKNTTEVLVEASIVGFQAYTHHNQLRKQISDLERSSRELVEFGYKLRNAGKHEESLRAFKLANQVGTSAIELRQIYPYETFLEAAWPF